jgi:hypothetical protein
MVVPDEKSRPGFDLLQKIERSLSASNRLFIYIHVYEKIIPQIKNRKKFVCRKKKN